MCIRILLAEDEERMAAALQELFRQEGYETDLADNGDKALQYARGGSYDVIVLDIMMPKMNGYEAAAAIRSCGDNTPILMLTAKSDIDDKVKGLDSGADDYLTKPFAAKELLARVRALIRRGSGDKERSLEYGDITLSPAAAKLSCKRTGESVRLSEKEYRILHYMISNSGIILSREQLALEIWGYDSEAEYNNVEVYMSFTRKKLAYIGSKTEIKAVRGIGYELRYSDVS